MATLGNRIVLEGRNQQIQPEIFEYFIYICNLWVICARFVLNSYNMSFLRCFCCVVLFLFVLKYLNSMVALISCKTDSQYELKHCNVFI
jgi:hypothetical protein